MVEDQVDTVECGSEEQNFLSKVHARPDGQAGGDLAESLPDSAGVASRPVLPSTLFSPFRLFFSLLAHPANSDRACQLRVRCLMDIQFGRVLLLTFAL
jgi:hypothetical protein